MADEEKVESMVYAKWFDLEMEGYCTERKQWCQVKDINVNQAEVGMSNGYVYFWKPLGATQLRFKSPLLVAAEEHLEWSSQQNKDMGGCDHDVGICMCADIRKVEEFAYAIRHAKGEPDPNDQPEPPDQELPDNMVTCKLCQKETPLAEAHRHQGGYVGECCWDERLRTTE